jgi:prophage regulatory protein
MTPIPKNEADLRKHAECLLSGNQQPGAGESLLRERPVLARVGLSRAYWWKLVAAGKAPRPIKIGRASLWIASEIDEFIQARIAASRAA